MQASPREVAHTLPNMCRRLKNYTIPSHCGFVQDGSPDQWTVLRAHASGRSAPSALCRRMLPGCPNPRPPSCTGRGWLVGPPQTEDEDHVAPGKDTKANESMHMQQTTTAVRRTTSLRLSFLSVVSVTPQFAPACWADPQLAEASTQHSQARHQCGRCSERQCQWVRISRPGGRLWGGHNGMLLQ